MDKKGKGQQRGTERSAGRQLEGLAGARENPRTTASWMAWANWWLVVLLAMLPNGKKGFVEHPDESR